jgi:hypothetical protein
VAAEIEALKERRAQLGESDWRGEGVLIARGIELSNVMARGGDRG